MQRLLLTSRGACARFGGSAGLQLSRRLTRLSSTALAAAAEALPSGASSTQDAYGIDAAPSHTGGAPKWKATRRFYKHVSVQALGTPVSMAYPHLLKRPSPSIELTCRQPGWGVLIDGRPLATNAMNTLALPTQALALAIAGEFAAQGEVILPSTTPLYNLACAAVDSYAVEDPDVTEDTEAYARAERLAGSEALDAAGGAAAAHAGRAGAMTSAAASGSSRLRDLLLDFLETDSTCFRIDTDSADASERLLLKRQEKYYAPLLAWWRETFRSELAVGMGLAELEHPDAAYAVAEDFCDGADPFLRAAAASVVGATKSSLITLAFLHRAIDLEAAFDAARVEEEWQIAENGFVEDGHDTGRAQLRTVLSAASAFLWLSPTSKPSELPRAGSKARAALLAEQQAGREQRVSARRAREFALVAAKRALLARAPAAFAALPPPPPFE